MKHFFLKSIAVCSIIVGSFAIHQSVSAACLNQFGAKQFDTTISSDRTTNPTTLKTKFMFNVDSAHPDCKGVTIPETFYDFSLSFTPVGFNNWTDIAIPDSSVKLKAGEWGTISIQPSVANLNPDYLYNIKFKEENELPDMEGKTLLFWNDKTEFDYINIKSGSITSSAASFTGSVTYTNKAAQTAGKIVPGKLLVARVYKKNGTKIAEG